MPNYYQKIQGWFDWSDLDNEMVNKYKNGGHFVEIGCYKGRSSIYLAELIIEKMANIQVDYIDPWDKMTSYLTEYKDISRCDVYNEFINHLNNVSHGDRRFKVIKNFSQLEVDNYPDNSLDYVFIDGDHSPEGLIKDVELFLPKMKKDSIMAGHDVNGEDVKKGLETLVSRGFDWFYGPTNCWRHNV